MGKPKARELTANETAEENAEWNTIEVQLEGGIGVPIRSFRFISLLLKT